MKKTLKITTLAAFTLIGMVSYGQSLNISGGFTTSTIKMEGMTEGTYTETFNGGTYTNSYEYKNIGGYNAALGYEFRLGNRLSMETGFKLQSRGYKLESEYSYVNGSENSKENYTVKYKMNYLDLPIVLNTAILTGDLRVYARTGIYAGLLTGSQYNERSEYSSSNGDNGVYEYSSNMTGDDLDERLTGGFVLGAGAEYKGFYFETNYNIGAYSLLDLDYEIYTQDLSFSLGYKWKFNK